MGITEEQFWRMTRHKYELHVEGYKKRLFNQREYDNYIAYLQGLYNRMALASTIGNAFLKKGQKPNEYPEKPFELEAKKPHEITEEEKEAQRVAFLESLKLMQKNFEMHQKKSGGA